MTDCHAEIAHTILQQLGGRHFIVMTGATLMRDGPALIVSLPKEFRGPGASGAHRIKITLTDMDLYRVEQIKMKRAPSYEVTTKVLAEMAYAEDLQRIFTEATGLDTHL